MGEDGTSSGRVLWEPSPERRDRALLTAFAAHARATSPAVSPDTSPDTSPAVSGVPADDYEALWRWSVEQVEDFWAAVWTFFDVSPGTSYERVLADRTMPGARWFPGAQVSFAAHVLRSATGREDAPALVAVAEDGATRELSWAALVAQVGAAATGLRRLGVQRGDRVAAYLPNVPEAVVAFLAVASLGAVWSACAPDIGARSAVDRFGQLDPVVLLTADGYVFGGRTFDRRDAAAELLDGLPSVRSVVRVPVLGLTTDDPRDVAWHDLLAEPGDAAPVAVPFDHPLWVVYSSGTTGLPKGLVHGHGGALLMGLVQQGLQNGTLPGDRLTWYTSTTWIMWNAIVCGLLVGATVVLYDGSPMHPTVDRLWELAEQQRLTSLGTSPGYLLACAKAGLHPAREHDLSALRTLGVTGSPLPASSYRWVHDEVSTGDLWLNPISGGTDFAAALVGGAPWLPVWEGEMSCRHLGCHVEAWDADGRPLVDEVGELVVRTPMPSMPTGIWGDADGSRYRDAYFDVYPGVWRHGDWVTVTSRGTAVVHGRSDSTLNRHGVRMGSADIYQAVEALPEVAEALVLGIEQEDGGYWLPLFVVLAEGQTLDEPLVARIRSAVREQASPRHVPDEVLEVPAVPHTMTGKKLEVPLKRILQGVAVERACHLGAVDDPQAVRWFATLADRRRTGA